MLFEEARVESKYYSQTLCFAEALSLDHKDVSGWVYLGVGGGGEVHGEQYSKKDCYVTALSLDQA